MDKWAPADAGQWVATFLQSVGVDAAVAKAAQAKIIEEEMDGGDLLDLSKQEVKDLLSIKLGPATKLVRAMKEVQEADPSPANARSVCPGTGGGDGPASGRSLLGMPQEVDDEQSVKRRKVDAAAAEDAGVTNTGEGAPTLVDISLAASAVRPTMEGATAESAKVADEGATLPMEETQHAQPQLARVAGCSPEAAAPVNGGCLSTVDLSSVQADCRSQQCASSPTGMQNARPPATPQQLRPNRMPASKGAPIHMAVDFMAVSQKVQEAEAMLQQLDGKDAVLLLGDSGVGKTTFFLFMAGSSVLSGGAGKDYEIKDIPEVLAGSRVSGETKSVTDTIACWPLIACEDTQRFDEVSGESLPKRSRSDHEEQARVPKEVMLVDTPGFNDTRGETFDVAMSILVKRIAERCATLRFVGFFDIKALSVRRGSVARDALTTLRKWVPNMESHLEAFTFIFTKPHDVLVRKMSGDEVPAVTAELVETIQHLREGSAADTQTLWKWIEDDLQKTNPSFTKVFVPHVADRDEVLSLILPAAAGSMDGIVLPAGIKNPRDVVQCGLNNSKEQALRVSLEAVIEALEVTFATATWQKAEVLEKMQALECMARQVGSELVFVDKAWQRARGLVHGKVENIKGELKRHIDDGTEIGNTGALVPGESFISAVLKLAEQLHSLADFGGRGAAENMVHHLRQQLKQIKVDVCKRLQIAHAEDPSQTIGLRNDFASLLAWCAVDGTAKDHFSEGIEAVRALLNHLKACAHPGSSDASKLLCKLACAQSLHKELLECPQDLHALSQDASCAAQALVATAIALVERDLSVVADQLSYLKKPVQGQLVEVGTLQAAIASVAAATQVIAAHKLEDILRDVSVKCDACQNTYMEGLMAARARVDATLGAETVVAPDTLEGEVKTDVLNVSRLHAALPASAAADAGVTNICSTVASMAKECAKRSSVELQRGMMKYEATKQVSGEDALLLASLLKRCSSLFWLQEVDHPLTTEMRTEVDTSTAKLLEFFTFEGEQIHLSLASLVADIGKKVDLEQVDRVKKGLRHFGSLTHFPGVEFKQLQVKEKERTCSALTKLQTATVWQECLRVNISSARTCHAASAELLLELAALDWDVLEISLSEAREQLCEHLRSLHQEVAELFGGNGDYKTKMYIGVAIKRFQGYPQMSSYLASPDTLCAMLRRSADAVFSSGCTACEESSPDWEQRVSACLEDLKSLADSFSACEGFEGIGAQSRGYEMDLQRSASTKRAKLERSVQAAIEDMDLKSIRGLLKEPAGDAVRQVRSHITSRYDAALQQKHNGAAMAAMFQLMTRVREDVGDVLLNFQQIDIQQKLDGACAVMLDQCRSLLNDLEKELSQDDFSKLLAKKLATWDYIDAVQDLVGNGRKEIRRRWEAVNDKIDGKIRKVQGFIDAFMASVGSISEGAINAVDSQKLKATLNKASQQLTNKEVAQVYEQWTTYFADKLVDHCARLHSLLDNQPEAASAIVEAARFLQEEWQSWMHEHLGRACPTLDVSQLLEAAQAKEEEMRIEFRDGLCSQGALEGLKQKLEQYSYWDRRWCTYRWSAQYYKFRDALEFTLDEMVADGDRRLSVHDFSAAHETFDASKRAVNVFKLHFQDPVKERVQQFAVRIREACVAMSGLLQKDIAAGCTSGRTVTYFQAFTEYVCYTLHLEKRPETKERRAECSSSCRAMHQAIIARVKQDTQMLQKHAEDAQVEELKSDLERCRKFAQVVVGAFAVYAEDVDPLLSSDSLLSETITCLKESFATGHGHWEIARAYARLDLPPTTTSADAICSQKKHMSMKHHPDKQLMHKNTANRRSTAMQNINASADILLKGQLDVDGYSRHIKSLHSEKVRQVLGQQFSQVQSRLDQHMYEDAKAILLQASLWRGLDQMVQPQLDVDGFERRVQEKIESHATQISNDALQHFENQRYKSLEHSLTGLVGLCNTFGASHDAMHQRLNAVVDLLRGRIMSRIESHVEQAGRSLATPSDAQMHSFAKDLISLGLIWCEITSFGAAAHKRIAELLNACLQEGEGLGATYLCKLGRYLAKEVDTGGETGMDGTMSHASVSQRLVHEFSQFQVVKNMLWNEAVQKMQKDPEACVREMTAKQLVGDSEVRLATSDLQAALQNFTDVYEDLLRRYLHEEVTLDEIIGKCIDTVASLRRAHAENNSRPIEVLAKEQIPIILAYVFMHYTIASSGESYISFLRASQADGTAEDGSAMDKGMRTPHNIQVLAVLRFFGFGEPNEVQMDRSSANSRKGLANQLVQVRTGEGKSLILGSAAVVFALLGFRVRCVCYSAHLSHRDALAFERTFSDFRVAGQITYSQITSYSEDSVAAQGDIRSLTLDLLRAKGSGASNSTRKRGRDQMIPTPSAVAQVAGTLPAISAAAQDQTLSAAGASAQPTGAIASIDTAMVAVAEASAGHELATLGENGHEVLLIDEVDVLWGPDFHGKTHDQLAQVHSQSVRSILETLWDRRNEANTSAGCLQLRGSIRQSAVYKQLLAELKGFEYVVSSQVDMMCRDLSDFLKEEEPVPIFDPSEGGRVGYKVLDGIQYNVVQGYKTAFAYLKNRDRLQDKDEKLSSVLTLLVPCGQFSYANISPHYIFGVSGTVEHLESYQRSEIRKHNLFTYTTMPSVYGKSGFLFLEEMHAIKICTDKDYHQEIALAIREKIDAHRAAVVFFKDSQALKAFRSSSYCQRLPPCDILEEALTDDAKEHLIKKAANTGQITLATAIFGRGSDFACFDDRLQARGGMHVLQTFVSLDVSEEVQIQGRTARQGKKGTYSLILKSDDISKELGLPASILQEGQSRCYERLQAARRGQQQKKFSDMAKQLAEAADRDALTRKYFESLRKGDLPAAGGQFKELYKQSTSTAATATYHYILCLDESSSMRGQKFELAKAAATNFVRAASELNAGTASAVSLVMFDNHARVACQQVPLDQVHAFARAITYNGGGTEFGPPLRNATSLITANVGRYDRHCVLLYTDGGASYPSLEVEALKATMQKYPDSIHFFAIAENDAPTLLQICTQLYPSAGAAEHCLRQVAPDQIAGKMLEALQRMNMGYVK